MPRIVHQPAPLSMFSTSMVADVELLRACDQVGSTRRIRGKLGQRSLGMPCSRSNPRMLPGELPTAEGGIFKRHWWRYLQPNVSSMIKCD
jgi:hypothetical protein